jgi:hypothetical protein
MKTLAVCYSKTGTTKKVAEAVVKKLDCDLDTILYDEKAQTVSASKNPSEYDRVIILSPVWAFSLAAPMKLYLSKHKAEIKSYSLIVTCSSGFGLSGCVRNCKSAIGNPPEKAVKLKSRIVNQDDFTIAL